MGVLGDPRATVQFVVGLLDDDTAYNCSATVLGGCLQAVRTDLASMIGRLCKVLA